MSTLNRRRVLREQIVALLQAGDFSGLKALADQEVGVAGQLLNYLFNPEDLLHWRAVEGLGYVAEAHPEQVRKLISRLLYQLNEDSGSFGWLAAAALGEVGRHQLFVVEEILPMFCGFLEQEFARVSMLWGLGRLLEVHPRVLPEAVPLLLALLQDPDPRVRGLAAWCLGRAGARDAQEALTRLLADDSQVELYDREQLQRTSVGRLAQEALDKMSDHE
ncbi:MAG: DVU0298 family protein [Desulfobaccales bacterium]